MIYAVCIASIVFPSMLIIGLYLEFIIKQQVKKELNRQNDNIIDVTPRNYL